ncbi:MAG: EAL domain-containing protein [Pseudomonadota bacterium]
MSSPSKRDAILRLQRDRFIGFAFAGGDLLIEADLSGTITYVVGAAQTISGHSDKEMIGQKLTDLVMPGLVESVARFLQDLGELGRAQPCRVGFEGVGGRWLVMSGHVSEERSDVLQLSFRFDLPEPVDTNAILDAGHFKNQLMEHLQPSSDAPTLTMLDLSELETWSEDAAQSCRHEIGKSLKGLCAEDSATGWLDDGVLGIVQQNEMDIDVLEATVRTHSKVADPKGIGLTPKAASLSMNSNGLHPGDAAQTLLYAINRFAETKGKGFSIGSLQDGFDRMVKETVQRVVEVRDTVNNDDVELNFQPIVDLKSGLAHHYEVLSRLKDGQSPFDLVCFAEQVGLVADFDLMVCRRVIAMLDARERRTIPLAINLSARSMESRAFGQALITLLSKFPKMRGQVMFELTESAAITDPEPVAGLITALRNKSYRVCLDDFGSGAAAFHYLRAFSFDYVKIDGMYVRSYGKRDRGILKGMAALCKELGVTSVAEMIETKVQADRLQRLGIDLGQGYFFGRPMAELPDSEDGWSEVSRRSARNPYQPPQARSRDSQQRNGQDRGQHYQFREGG